MKVETIIDNETGAILKSEQETADAEDAAQTGSEVKTVDHDFTDGDDDDDDDDDAITDGGHGS